MKQKHVGAKKYSITCLKCLSINWILILSTDMKPNFNFNNEVKNTEFCIPETHV